jgi:hypothetical protein
MVTQKVDAQDDLQRKSGTHRADEGFCLGCGAWLSRCGKPFSDAIECYKCHVVNIYEESQQPIRVGSK